MKIPTNYVRVPKQRVCDFGMYSFRRDPSFRGPQVTCADQKESLAPKINCVHFNKQPFRLGTGGDWGFRGGDRGLGTYTWRCSTMNKQPFRLGTGVLGVGTGDWGLIHGDVLQ